MYLWCDIFVPNSKGQAKLNKRRVSQIKPPQIHVILSPNQAVLFLSWGSTSVKANELASFSEKLFPCLLLCKVLLKGQWCTPSLAILVSSTNDCFGEAWIYFWYSIQSYPWRGDNHHGRPEPLERDTRLHTQQGLFCDPSAWSWAHCKKSFVSWATAGNSSNKIRTKDKKTFSGNL